MNLKNTNILFFIGILLCNYFSINSQCLDTGGIGRFTDQSTFTSDWFSATQGNGTFTISNTGAYYGSAALKVDVNTESPWQVRMYNRAGCYFNMTNGEKFTVSFYAKGTVGNEFKVTLMNAGANIEAINQEIALDEWTFYTVTLTSDVTTSNGRIKFSFIDEGSYEIDEIIVSSGEKNTWYVSPSGTNSLSGNNGLSSTSPLKTIGYAVNTAWNPGDIIYVMNGTYQNNNYGSGVNNSQVVYINKSGTLNGPLVIRNHPGHTPKIEFDGSGGFICNKAEYLEISGFEIQGPNQNITQSEAEANRLNSNKYYKGRGIAIWASASGGRYITLHSNKVYDCPGSGIRINNSDYCTITNNEVYNCTTWSSAGESAIVLAQSRAIDSDDKIKMRITKNKVYDNVNKIHYFNSSYTCSDPTAYGCEDYPNIIDGSGCYITRNNDRETGGNDENPNGQYTGYFYFGNNISYGNGINGVVVHKSDNSIVMNNTCYINGAVPISEGRQNAVGITVNNSVGVRIYNNIVWTEFSTDYGYQSFGTTSDIIGTNNMLINGMSNISGLTGTLTSDPLFIDKDNFDFRLTSLSPAIDAGVLENNISPLTGTIASEYIPNYDFENNSRMLTTSDIGAFETIDSSTLRISSTLSITDDVDHPVEEINIYPNPATNIITISGVLSTDDISIYDQFGKTYIRSQKHNDYSKQRIIDVSNLKAGLYLIQVSKNNITKTLKCIKH